MPDALRKADEVLQQAVQGITDLINVPAVINLDFADVQTVMKDKGIAHIGIGFGKGEDKAAEAIKMAVESPLLETTINSATDVILNVSGDISIFDANDAASFVQELTGEDVNVIFGAKYDETMTDSCTITVIATGLDQAGNNANKIGSNFSVTPKTNVSVNKPKPAGINVIQAGNTNVTQNTVPVRPIQGIQRPADLKSNVQEKSLKIPDFLKR